MVPFLSPIRRLSLEWRFRQTSLRRAWRSGEEQARGYGNVGPNRAIAHCCTAAAISMNSPFRLPADVRKNTANSAQRMPSACFCFAQSAGMSQRISLAAVRLAGCRPFRISFTISGESQAIRTRREIRLRH